MTDTAGTLNRTHPVESALLGVRDLEGVGEVPLWSVDDETARRLLVLATQVGSQLAELKARVAAHAETVEAGQATGATSTANWWAHATRMTRPEAHRRVRLAAALETHPRTRAAMATGDVLPDQALVITGAVGALPDTVDPQVRRQAEDHLIDKAAEFDARHLKILGRRILAVVDPTAGDAHEAALLEKEERAAERATSFAMTRDGHGKAHGRFTLPEAQAAMLEKALRAIAAPKHQRAVHGAGGYDHTRPSPERMGQALCEYVERYPAEGLPESGGINATVVVTMTLETLRGGLAAAALDTGEEITAGQARRLACEAGLVPAVLGTGSVILDLGRRTRLHTAAQRLALTITQKQCQHPTCDVPAARCHVHHTLGWARGGPTDLINAQLLCPFHHHLAHRDIDIPLRT